MCSTVPCGDGEEDCDRDTAAAVKMSAKSPTQRTVACQSLRLLSAFIPGSGLKHRVIGEDRVVGVGVALAGADDHGACKPVVRADGRIEHGRNAEIEFTVAPPAGIVTI